MRKTCLICGEPLTNASRGRRRIYCKTVCRRQRERILARLRRILRRLEARRDKYAEPGNSYGAHQLKYLMPMLEAARESLAGELARVVAG